MKVKRTFVKILFFILFLGNCNNSFAKIEADTITNWQLYKDSDLILRSHFLDSNRYLVKLKISEKYEALNLSFNYCSPGKKLNRRLELVYGKNVLATVSDKNHSDVKLKIPRKEIDKTVKGFLNKEISIKYFDEGNPNGIIIGVLKFVK